MPERQAGFDFVPFDFAATRRDVDKAMANYALQVYSVCRGVPLVFRSTTAEPGPSV